MVGNPKLTLLFACWRRLPVGRKRSYVRLAGHSPGIPTLEVSALDIPGSKESTKPKSIRSSRAEDYEQMGAAKWISSSATIGTIGLLATEP
jgi:hypothetical protein